MTAERLAEIQGLMESAEAGFLPAGERTTEGLASAVRDLLAEHDAAQERRRYALLQAAAVMYCGLAGPVDNCVNCAELLLAEIERREKP